MYEFHLWLSEGYCEAGPRLLIQSAADGHLGGFHFLAVVNNAAMDIRMQISLWMCALMSLGCIPRRRIVGLYGNYKVNNLLNNC